MKINLADREAEIMEVLWGAGPSTVNEVRSRLTDKLAYTTVLTHLQVLESKGHIGHSEEGRAHRYHALTDRVDAQKGALQALISRLFQGSSDALLVHLVANEKLSAKQVQRIEELLRKQTGKRRT